MKRITCVMLITLSVLALGLGPASAGKIGDLIQFEGGTRAVAEEVNDNFNDIKVEVNKNVDDITANASTISSNTTKIGANTTAIAGKQNRVSGECSAGNSIRVINANGTVVCEPDSVGGATGVDFATAGNKYITTTDSTIISQSITAPQDGFVLAIFSAQVYMYHSSGVFQIMRCWMNANASATPYGMGVRYIMAGSNYPTAWYYDTVSMSTMFPVSKGTTTIYVRGDSAEASGSTNTYFTYNQLNLMFFPSRY